jgi:hypothetical protein
MSELAKIARMVFSIIFVLFSFSANAFDFDGAWVVDATKCGKVFVKRNNRIEMARHSDVFGGGFIVEGNQIRGALLTCKITDRKEESAILHLIALCSTKVALLSPMPLDLKIDDTDKVTRLYPSFPKITVSYTRCKL